MKARSSPGTEVRPTLAQVGISKNLSSRAQKLEAVREEYQFEALEIKTSIDFEPECIHSVSTNGKM